MDQKRIGAFIAQCRKEETVNLTVYCRKLVCTTLLIRQAKMIF